ncbi:hypothetical protein RhiirA4_412970 [Rhizophagus irregularis]|uniref:Serine-threonine/tyrosine-protein kinase catalytic domain-containing protein n=1 Tax=Rhizophagus irregularis TaxID=588596 RepID=A0A2I1HS06_9GLOM|nr:hypothetical protein RhiirA4_412970 [Rhizophagus irregularis]
MTECWHSDPEKRPTATDVYYRIEKIKENERNASSLNQTKIIKSSDIGPITTNNPGAIYKSRPLSSMINSAMSLRSSRSLSINLGTGQCIKKEKLCENEINEYLTNEIEFDINMNFNQSHKPHNKGK